MLASPAPRRVLMVTGEYPPQVGGVADYAAQLTAALQPLGHHVTVLTSRPLDAAPRAGPSACRQVTDWGPAAWRQIEYAADQIQAQIIHIQYQTGAYQLKGAINLLPLWLRARRPAL